MLYQEKINKIPPNNSEANTLELRENVEEFCIDNRVWIMNKLGL